MDATSTPPLHCFMAPFFMITGTVRWILVMFGGVGTVGIVSCMSNKPVHVSQAVLVVLVVGWDFA